MKQTLSYANKKIIHPIQFGFLGAHSLGIKVLTSLLKMHMKPAFIITLPEQSADELNSFRSLAQQHSIPLTVEKTLKNHDKKIAACDFILVASFTVIPKAQLTMPKWGFINLHPSLLPKYRGVHPIAWALISGDSKTGVSLHYVVEELDAGDIISQHSCTLLPHHSIHTLTATLDAIAAKMATDLIISMQKTGEKPMAKPQQLGASYATERTAADSRISWQMPASMVVNLIRALQPPSPLAFAFDEQENPIQFIKAHTVVCNKGPCGEILAVHPPKLITVRCQQHAVVLETAQPFKSIPGDNLY